MSLYGNEEQKPKLSDTRWTNVNFFTELGEPSIPVRDGRCVLAAGCSPSLLVSIRG